MFADLALVAIATEAMVGYPNAVYRLVGHPVSWIGKFITWCDEAWNSGARTSRERRLYGVLTLVLLIAISLLVGFALAAVLERLFSGIAVLVLSGVLASTLLAQRSLDSHVLDVAKGLETDGLDGGRLAVAHIVGRETRELDEAGVCRAAIESLAENFSDGVVAPLFWMAVAGLPGALAYKAINTADSMIGHKTARHRDFGFASARLDDLVNLPASRLSALLIVLAAAISNGASPSGAWRAVFRDARHHRSPNAGWPEAALAGALGLALAGPRVYDGILVNDATMGDGRRDA
ncbi:MAG TPA: adenosylcobinamide-phosphate synthase CbiB, partial [Reyranella sp.]|nr:adenosylcobinamide-phosphate synthase CbiB [Reyranella sp.]